MFRGRLTLLLLLLPLLLDGARGRRRGRDYNALIGRGHGPQPSLKGTHPPLQPPKGLDDVLQDSRNPQLWGSAAAKRAIGDNPVMIPGPPPTGSSITTSGMMGGGHHCPLIRGAPDRKLPPLLMYAPFDAPPRVSEGHSWSRLHLFQPSPEINSATFFDL